MHFLVILSNFYENISTTLLQDAVAEIEQHNHTYQKISVPGALEIPAVISYAADSEIYDGFIALGCIVKGETIHHEIIAQESMRAINELAINLNLAVGNGIIAADNKQQAIIRAEERHKGRQAAKTAIHMAVIRKKFSEVASN